MPEKDSDSLSIARRYPESLLLLRQGVVVIVVVVVVIVVVVVVVVVVMFSIQSVNFGNYYERHTDTQTQLMTRPLPSLPPTANT